MPSRVLLVEDDDRLGRQVVQSLTAAGFAPEWVMRGDDAIAFDLANCELVILDLMLPGAHGFDVLKALRANDHHVPVLVLSARQDSVDKVRALELGADDYLTKPFWPDELIARVRARLRRPVLAADSGAAEIGDLRVEFGARTASVAGVPVELTRAEFEIVAALARRPGAAVSRAFLVERSLDPNGDGDERTLDVHVSRIRRKFGTAGALIGTVWGVGYRLKATR